MKWAGRGSAICSVRPSLFTRRPSASAVQANGSAAHHLSPPRPHGELPKFLHKGPPMQRPAGGLGVNSGSKPSSTAMV